MLLGMVIVVNFYCPGAFIEVLFGFYSSGSY